MNPPRAPCVSRPVPFLRPRGIAFREHASAEASLVQRTELAGNGIRATCSK